MSVIDLDLALQLDNTVDIDLYDYRSVKEISKQQIILRKNTFSFLLEGSKHVFSETADHAISHDKFLLMKSGNCLMTEVLSQPQRRYRSMLLFFSDEALARLISKLDISHQSGATNSSIFSFEYDGFIRRFVDSLQELDRLDSRVKTSLLVVKFEEIMLYLLSKYGSGFISSLLRDKSRQVSKLRSVVEHNKLTRLSLKELAFLADMSVSTFKREFDKLYGMSPIRLFQERRLDHAAFLIQDMGKRPSEVFVEVGYENLSSFIQAYKSRFGSTPKQHIVN